MEAAWFIRPTLVGSTTTATVIIANQGSGAGLVNSISVTGGAFQPQSLPLTPFSVAPGTDVTFVINYVPSAGSDRHRNTQY